MFFPCPTLALRKTNDLIEDDANKGRSDCRKLQSYWYGFMLLCNIPATTSTQRMVYAVSKRIVTIHVWNGFVFCNILWL